MLTNMKRFWPLGKVGVPALGLLLLPLVGAGFFGCEAPKDYSGLVLPPTPVLTIQNRWALVTSTLLRVRSEGSDASALVTVLRRGAIIEVLSTSPREEVLEGQRGRWIEIQDQGRRGWVFGAYLQIFDSLDKARNAARQL